MRGNQVSVSIIMFFVGTVMAIGGVYFYQRASENDFALVDHKLNTMRSEVKASKDEFDRAAEGVGKMVSTVASLAQRVEALEKKNPEVSVKLTMPDKPIEVDVVPRPKLHALPVQKKKMRNQ